MLYCYSSYYAFLSVFLLSSLKWILPASREIQTMHPPLKKSAAEKNHCSLRMCIYL